MSEHTPGPSVTAQYERAEKWKARCAKAESINRDLLAALKMTDDQLGEAIHTSLRKVGSSHASNQAWHAITDIPDDEWRQILDFILGGLQIRAAIAKAKG